MTNMDGLTKEQIDKIYGQIPKEERDNLEVMAKKILEIRHKAEIKKYVVETWLGERRADDGHESEK